MITMYNYDDFVYVIQVGAITINIQFGVITVCVKFCTVTVIVFDLCKRLMIGIIQYFPQVYD